MALTANVANRATNKSFMVSKFLTESKHYFGNFHYPTDTFLHKLRFLASMTLIYEKKPFQFNLLTLYIYSTLRLTSLPYILSVLYIS